MVLISTTEETRRVYDGMDVVQERNQSDIVTASYTRTGNIGGILARTTSSGSVFYGYDGGGNVVTLTNNSGAQVGSYTYDAFGNTVAQSGWAANENPYRFSTKEQIGGLYSYGLRFYSPGLGRFINRDPIGEAGGANLYGFVGNDPVNAVDAYGLAPGAAPIPGIVDLAKAGGSKMAQSVASAGNAALNTGKVAVSVSAVSTMAVMLSLLNVMAKPAGEVTKTKTRNSSFKLALGLFPGLAAFAAEHGALWSANWDTVGITSKAYGNLQFEILAAMGLSKKIYFKLDGFDQSQAKSDWNKGLVTGGSPWTRWEYCTIRNSPFLMSKTSFWKGGMQTAPIGWP